jgi:hypothetical protein
MNPWQPATMQNEIIEILDIRINQTGENSKYCFENCSFIWNI